MTLPAPATDDRQYPPRPTPAPHVLRCAEVWGGIRDEDLDACSRTVTASLFSQACEGGKGGDIYFLSVCAWDDLTRIAVADVCGHGEAVSDTSDWLHGLLVKHMNDLAGDALLSELNRRVVQRGFRALTTAAIAAVCRSERTAYFSTAGHHPVLLRQRGGGRWREVCAVRPDAGLVNMPLGLTSETVYQQWQVPTEPGDRLVLYTDGVIEAVDAAGELFGVERLAALLDAHADRPLHEVRAAALGAVRDFAGGSLAHDDVTLLAVEVR